MLRDDMGRFWSGGAVPPPPRRDATTGQFARDGVTPVPAIRDAATGRFLRGGNDELALSGHPGAPGDGFLEEEPPIIRHPLAKLTGRMCHWPIGDPREPDFAYCGEPKDPAGPYCKKHAAMSVSGEKPKRLSCPDDPTVFLIPPNKSRKKAAQAAVL